MEMTRPKTQLVLSIRTRPTKTTPQQERFREVAKHCGIHKGMTRADLMKSMQCISEHYRENNA